MAQTILILIFATTLILDLCVVLLIRHTLFQARIISYISVLLMSFLFAASVGLELSLMSLIFGIATLFRIINMARVSVARIKPIELSLRFRRTAIYLGITSVIIGFLILQKPDVSWLYLSLITSNVAGSLFICSTLVVLWRYRAQPHDKINLLTKLPTVSVCIPARNETQDLPECIETVLASTYPKLEILVLDDCSHDKTPAIIKEYAHKGVRFLSGEEPTQSWLAKNKAMDKLYEESTGEIVLFAGVDVRFSTDTIQQLVMMMEGGKRMVSVLPRRSYGHELSVFIQPLRYWWEIAVPRFLGNRPPVFSTAWAIYRSDFKKLGEFNSVKRSVQPEAHFVKRMRDVYGFVVSGGRLGLVSTKAPREQYDTALRVRYPQLKRRPESVFGLLLVETIIFMTPLIGIISGIITDNNVTLSLAIIALALLLITNTIISSLTVRKTWLFGFVTLPFLLFEEWYLLVRSMFSYEFGRIIWKERNICLPMLQVEKRLPAIDK